MFKESILNSLFTIPFIFVFSFFLQAQNNNIQKNENSTVYAGIEVGSKGVKMSLLELNKADGRR